MQSLVTRSEICKPLLTSSSVAQSLISCCTAVTTSACSMLILATFHPHSHRHNCRTSIVRPSSGRQSNRSIQDGVCTLEHSPLIADPLGEADPIEIFQQFDRNATTEIGSVAKGRDIEPSAVGMGSERMHLGRQV